MHVQPAVGAALDVIGRAIEQLLGVVDDGRGDGVALRPRLPAGRYYERCYICERCHVERRLLIYLSAGPRLLPMLRRRATAGPQPTDGPSFVIAGAS